MQSQGVGTSLTTANRSEPSSARRKPGLGLPPTRENGSRVTTSANAMSGQSGIFSCSFMMRIGPIHITSASPAQYRGFGAAGAGRWPHLDLDPLGLVGAGRMRRVERRVEHETIILEQRELHGHPPAARLSLARHWIRE